jgi:cobyrinic acid a,c-diamide synthase
MKVLVIAGTHSGVGKTTVAASVLAALRRRGLRVQAFKAGPDYIDPSYLSRAAGSPCRNLDTWLLPPDAIGELVARRAPHCDIGIIEGVMGLFDGRSGEDEAGSAAHLAKLLGAPVILVVDAYAMARSAAAMVLGYQRFDPELPLAGVILNRVAGQAHYEMAAGPIKQATSLPVLGYLPRDEALRLPERHLGLIPMVEGPAGDEFFQRLAETVERQIDLDLLLRLGSTFQWRGARRLFPAKPLPPRARIAVATDRAFSFYYQDSLDLLEAWGAEIAPFSPLADPALPPGTDAVYIGGGFPELYARELAQNEGMKRSLQEAARRGKPIYGECGGLMYLGETLGDPLGCTYPMAGLVPLSSTMGGRRLTLGYREARLLHDSPFLPAGETVRGHEFHWSELSEPPPRSKAAYLLPDKGDRPEGYAEGSVFASYLHVHLASDPRLAPNFMATAARARHSKCGTGGGR